MAHPAQNPVTLAFGGLFALAAAMGLGRFLYTPVLPFMAEDLGLTNSQAGLIASANFLGYMLGAYWTSSAIFSGRVRTWFLAGLLVSALTTGAMAMTISLPAFMGLRFVGGVASAFVLVFSSSLIIERLARDGKTGLTAVLFGGVGVGIAISAVLVSTLADFGQDWRAQWMWGGVISLLALGPAYFLIPERRTEGPSVAPSVNGRISRPLRALIVAYGLFGFGYIITGTFITTIVRAAPAISPYETEIWLAVGLAGMPSVWLWNVIARRLGLALTIAVACLVEATGVAMSVLAENALAVGLAGAMLGGTFMGITALGLVYARELTDADPRRALGLMTAAFGLGQMIGPALAGWLQSITGTFVLPSLVATLALVISAGLTVKFKPAVQPGAGG